MSDSSSLVYEDGTPSGMPQPAGPIPPQGQYRFSPEEMRVLKECNSESFFQRSLPLGTVLGLATYFGVQKGHLKPNSRFGAFPKVSLAVIVGYFIGKISYQQACAEKLMAIPGSYLGQLLRDKKAGKLGPQRQTRTMLGADPSDIYSDAGPGNSLDLDTDRPLFNDDSYRPGSDMGTPSQPPEDVVTSPKMSYEDLRKKNRGDYAETRRDPYRVDPNQGPIVKRAQPPPPPSVSTNKYGDAME